MKAPGVLTFDEATHTYRIDGAVVPSVTQVLAPLKDFSAIPPAVLERKRLYGSAVHKMIEREIKGELEFGEQPDDLTGALEAFWRWREENPRITDQLHKAIVERPMGHDRFGYAGTPDLILDGVLVVDLKTRAPDMLVDSIQCAAYQELWQRNGGCAGAGKKGQYEHRILYLKDDGTYQYQNVNHADALNRFRHLLDYYNSAQTLKTWRA